MSKQKKYTEKFKKQIVSLYNIGNYLLPMIKKEYGVERSTVSK